jgi:hypothetical protein
MADFSTLEKCVIKALDKIAEKNDWANIHRNLWC